MTVKRFTVFPGTDIECDLRLEGFEVFDFIEVVDMGDVVLCDDCGDDYTQSMAKGGIMFETKAICPSCTPKWLELAKKFNEEYAIRARCPEGKSFADWVREDLR